MERGKAKKAAVNFLKIAVSIALLYFVFRKIPFAEVAKLWRSVNIFYLLPAALLFFISQILSAKRLLMYFHASEFMLSFRSNLELYFLGMFYNFFIPGGVGGDAYKAWLLNKKFSWPAKQLASALFSDRLSGLTAICLLMCLIAVFTLPQFTVWLVLMFLAGFAAALFLSRKLFPRFKDIFIRTLGLSFLVQIFQIGSFILLLMSIGVKAGITNYALLFLASSVLSLVSFAGIGVREMLFLQAAKYFDFSPQYSISASLLFTVITAFFSLSGLYFQIRKLNLTLSK